MSIMSDGKRAKRRMDVKIVRGSASNGPGLPRPLAPAPDGKLRPVPYTNGDEWGILHEFRTGHCEQTSACLVCGLIVNVGVAFYTGSRTPRTPRYLTSDSLGYGAMADGAPLHSRCAKMTLAHCKHIRDRHAAGELPVVPYFRERETVPADLLDSDPRDE